MSASSKTCFGTNVTLAQSCCATANGTWNPKNSGCQLPPLSDAFKTCLDLGAGSNTTMASVQCNLNSNDVVSGAPALRLGRGGMLALVACAAVSVAAAVTGA